MDFTLDTKLEKFLDDPKAKAALDKYLPGASTSPVVGLAKGMSLRMVLSLPQAKQLGLTEAKAESILMEINKRS